MTISLTVITCAHNPRREYFDKVLRSLMSQTLPLDQWEYLLIDNKSEQDLASEIDISWHPHARHIREEKLGLTPARLRGIKESQAKVLIFVDDDNVLQENYLEVALQISKDYPFIGAWGGQVIGEFEVSPPEYLKPYLPFLAIHEFNQDKWSNLLHQYETTPCGAGLCVRRVVAEKYAELIDQTPKRSELGRKGKLLFSCEDSDLAFTACDSGFGTGLFSSLKLQHLIPKERLEESYLLRLVEGIEYSNILLESFRQLVKAPPPLSWRDKLYEKRKMMKMKPHERRFYIARKNGIEKAYSILKNSH